MAQQTHNLEIDKGTTFEQCFTWSDDKGEPFDLTGASARMQVRKNSRAPNAILSLSSKDGEIQLGGKTGEITVEIPAAQTSKLTDSSGVYDLVITFPNGKVTRLLSGNVKFNRGVTR